MRLVASLATCLVLLSGLTPNAASAYPTRPVTLVLGFAPGGPSDVMARIFSKRLEQALGQPVVIENRSGAGGNIAGEMVARATSRRLHAPARQFRHPRRQRGALQTHRL